VSKEIHSSSKNLASILDLIVEAEGFLAAGDVDAAEEKYRLVLEEDKKNIAALRGRASVAQARGHKKRAARYSKKANTLEAENFCQEAEKASEDALYPRAIRYYEKALVAEPESLDAIWGIAECYASLDERKKAAKWYQRYLDLEPNEPEAMHMLSAMGEGDAPNRASDGYVATLFDRFAPDFDKQLTGELDYQVPKILAATIRNQFPTAKNSLDILDLGCGTGLGGVAFKKLAKRIDGVDLSGEMLKRARKRRIYKTLKKADIITYMERARRQYDVVLGADVFVYFGALEDPFNGFSKVLKPGGYVVFSLEARKGVGFKLTPSGRYAHGRRYVRDTAERAGLVEQAVNRETLRLEYGEPVHGDVWVFQVPFN